MQGLPPLTDTERTEALEAFNIWAEQYAGPDYNYTDGELTWLWAYWHHRHALTEVYDCDKCDLCEDHCALK